MAVGTKGETWEGDLARKYDTGSFSMVPQLAARKFNKALTVAYKEARKPLSAIRGTVFDFVSWNVD